MIPGPRHATGCRGKEDPAVFSGSKKSARMDPLSSPSLCSQYHRLKSDCHCRGVVADKNRVPEIDEPREVLALWPGPERRRYLVAVQPVERRQSADARAGLCRLVKAI